MNQQTPTIGRIVTYVLTEQDAEQINKRRRDAAEHKLTREDDGAQVHTGNQVRAGHRVAAVVTAVWTNTLVNLKCLLDGNDDFWRTSTESEVIGDAGPTDGRWHWPTRVG